MYNDASNIISFINLLLVPSIIDTLSEPELATYIVFLVSKDIDMVLGFWPTTTSSFLFNPSEHFGR